MNVEAVDKPDGLVLAEGRRDVLGVDGGHGVVRMGDNDKPRRADGIADRKWREPGAAGELVAWPAGTLADNDAHAGVAQIQCMRVALVAVADDGDGVIEQ